MTGPVRIPTTLRYGGMLGMNQLVGSPNPISAHMLLASASELANPGIAAIWVGSDKMGTTSMNRIAFRFGIVLVLALAWAWQSASGYDSADAIRCSGDLVNIGDTVERLLDACGEPIQRDGNQWTYQPEQGSLVHTVGVGNGKVIYIRVGEQ